MHKRTLPKIFGHAKQLHRNLTPAEARLWARLRAHRMKDIHFRNQHAIGNYVVDFCSPRKKLVIEIDGTPFGRSTWNRKSMMLNAARS
jgi:very-short-patch-repair endonuclease